MNFELVGRMAPMQLTVSPQLLSPLADFAHSSKVRYPACITNAPPPHTYFALCDIVVGITCALGSNSLVLPCSRHVPPPPLLVDSRRTLETCAALLQVGDVHMWLRRIPPAHLLRRECLHNIVGSFSKRVRTKQFLSGLSPFRRLPVNALLQISTPGLILPARSPALDNLRVLAAGCRACSTKGHVADVLRARGTKDIDVRAAGFTVRFELEPRSTAVKVARPPSPSGSTGDEGGGLMRSEHELPGGGEVKTEEEEVAGDAQASSAKPAGASEGGARASPRTCLELAIGCCIYQKGRYLLGHAEGVGSTTASPRNPAGLSSRVPPLPPPPPPPPPSLPLSPTPLPPVREANNGKEVEGGIDGEAREDHVHSPEERTGAGVSRGVQPSTSKTATSLPPTPGSAGKAVGGRVHEAGATLWGGGPGPRPCREALTIVQSLRVPLSDPHYFRIADLSIYLGVFGAEEQDEAGSEALAQRTQVLGGQDNADEGWTGELLVTRCAVVGNPRQPGTRADAMLSRIRVEVRLCVTSALGIEITIVSRTTVK